MELRLQDLLNYRDGVKKIMEETVDFRLAYRLTKNIKKIDPELYGLEQSRIKLIEKYGDKNPKGIEVKPECIEDFVRDYSELLGNKVNINIELIPISLLEKIDKIKTSILVLVYPFIDDKQ
jgi:hypothetical protein